MKRRIALATFALGPVGTTQMARAQILGSSDRIIRIILGLPAGGSTDAIARIIAPYLEKPLKAKIIVENKPGAGARIANTYVKNARPDGNTLLLTSSSLMAVYPHIFKQLGHEPLHDFLPVNSIIDMDYGYVASTAAAPGIKTLREYIQWVRSNPLSGNCGAVGSGSIPHFLGFLLARAGGKQLKHVSFKGVASHLQALNVGHIPFSSDVTAGIAPHIASGRVRLLATSGSERSVEGVSTAREAGFPESTTDDYTGLFYPSDTPVEYVQKAHAAVKLALQQPSVQESLRLIAFKPSGTAPTHFSQRVASDFQWWRRVVEDSGFKSLH